MNLLYLVLSLFLISDNSSELKESENKIVLSGKKIDSSEFNEVELKKVERRDGESVTDMMMRVQGYEELPKANSFSNCSELLNILNEKKIKIISTNDNLVVVETKKGKTLKYQFENSQCPTS